MCSNGYAYQEPATGGDCAGFDPEQDFDQEAGIGWAFSLLLDGYGPGITGPDTVFMPPSFSGLPFSSAAFLQDDTSAIAQEIGGFIPGHVYLLSFYLGSRYASGCCDGNQTVTATLGQQVIGTWPLVSFTPFTLEKVLFRAPASGTSHILTFRGTASGDHTAFFSLVEITGLS